MRPLVRTAMQVSSARERQERKATKDAKASPAAKERATNSKSSKGNTLPSRDDSSAELDGPPPDKHASAPKEFTTHSTSAPRRLNDIAMAPPDLKKLPRGAKKNGAAGKGDGAGKAGILSMAQRAMMEAERENAIARYRELKERRLQESGRSHGALEPDES